MADFVGESVDVVRKGYRCVMEVHQELKCQKFLTPWHSVPSDADVVFVSHEWLSWAHPSTEMDPFHTMMYKHKFTTKSEDWKSMVDWFSIPQPGTEKVEDIGREEMSVLLIRFDRFQRTWRDSI